MNFFTILYCWNFLRVFWLCFSRSDLSLHLFLVLLSSELLLAVIVKTLIESLGESFQDRESLNMWILRVIDSGIVVGRLEGVLAMIIGQHWKTVHEWCLFKGIIRLYSEKRRQGINRASSYLPFLERRLYFGLNRYFDFRNWWCQAWKLNS